jgi:SPP1 family predicted phage head-tail adaptor
MRAGKLDKTICIERAGTVVDDYGTPSQGWEEIATTKAQIIQSSTEEFMKSYGSDATRAVVFRIRWRADLIVTDRVTMQGQQFDVVEIKELGRRDGLELRTLATA